MGSTADVDFNNFIDAVTSFDDVKSKRTKLSDAEKSQIEVKSKLSKLERGKTDKQQKEIENIKNCYNARDEIIKFYKDYSSMIFNAG